MSDKKTDKKEHKMNLSEKVDANCFKMFGYTPAEITEINEVLADCDSLISYHMENTGALSEETRKTISDLAIEQDLINIELDDLFLTALNHIKEARTVEYLKQEPTLQRDEEFLKKLEKVKEDIRSLLHKIREYIHIIQNHKY